jgi:hypothetical protein
MTPRREEEGAAKKGEVRPRAPEGAVQGLRHGTVQARAPEGRRAVCGVGRDDVRERNAAPVQKRCALVAHRSERHAVQRLVAHLVINRRKRREHRRLARADAPGKHEQVERVGEHGAQQRFFLRNGWSALWKWRLKWVRMSTCE